MADENECSDLDPELWKDLPADLLERVIAKLPFSRAAAFRAVCKSWYSYVVPRATAHTEHSSGAVLLYFSYLKQNPFFHEDYSPEFAGPARWQQICNTKTEWRSYLYQEFHQKSFPAPRNGEDVKLLICERGLLFFEFVCRESRLARDIVVCNPLTSQWKSLSLPGRLGPSFPYEWYTVLTGVVFDSTTGSYCFVYAGLEKTYLYDSMTSSWTNGTSLLPTLREGSMGQGRDALFPFSLLSHRSLCSNGNLYWYTTFPFRDGCQRSFVIKFDVKHGVWSLIPDLVERCVDDSLVSSSFIASGNGEILITHLHRDFFNQDNAAHLQYTDWPCRVNRNLAMASEIKMMPFKFMEKVFPFLHGLFPFLHGLELLYAYEAFSHGHCICHLLSNHINSKILVHDINENSYTESAWLDALDGRIWSFQPSLTSSP